MASIQVIQGPDRGRIFELHDGDNVIGRKSGTVHLSDGTVSRNHAQLVIHSGQWMLEDLGSANGTFLNGVRVSTSMTAHGGDQIRCGSSLLVFAGGIPVQAAVDVDEDGKLVDAAIVARMPSNEDSIIIPTPEAGAQAIDTLRILYSLITEVSSVFNVDTLLQRTLDKIWEVITPERGYMLLIDEAGQITPKASRIPQGDKEETEIPISRTIINEVVGKEVGVLSSNAMSDKRFTSGKSVHNFGIRSAICVPIKGRERILGVIYVDCGVSQHTYSTEQLRLLTAIGYQTGLAIENVQLYQAAIQSERLAAVGETVALLSHHIKNILQALGAGIDIVEMGLQRNDIAKAKEAWPIVQRNLKRTNDLILNMLAFSKAREPLVSNINVNHVIEECIELQSPSADERGIAILSDLDDMPPIPADEAGLRQVFVNLLSNAMDAVESQHGVITIASNYDSMHRRVIVRVIDNGPGIPSQQLQDIFNPFWSSKGHGGTGLGLAVAKKVVQEHNGFIQVASTAEEGTVFTVNLPAMSVGESDETSASPR